MIHHIRYLEKKFGIINEYGQKLNEIIKYDSARGFNKITGITKNNIVGTSISAKMALSNANATVYELSIKELIRKLTWQTELEIRRQKALFKQFATDIINQIEWELEIFEGRRKLSRAELEYEKNRIELRGVEFLKLKAEAQYQIMELKRQQALLEKEIFPYLYDALQAEIQAVDARKKVLEVMIKITMNELQLLEAERRKNLKEVELNNAEMQVIEKQLQLLPKYQEKLQASMALVAAVREHLKAIITHGLLAEEAEYKAKQAEYKYIQRDKEIDIEERKIRNEVSNMEDMTQIIREEERIAIARHKLSLAKQADDLRKSIHSKRIDLEYDKRLDEKKISIDSAISNHKTRISATNESAQQKLDAVKDSTISQADALAKAVIRIHRSRRKSYLEHIIHRRGTPPSPGPLPSPPPPSVNFGVTHTTKGGVS